MEIADQRAHALLAYTWAVEQQGRRLSPAEFEAYADSPTLKVTNFMATALATTLGSINRSERYEDWFARLGWITYAGGAVRLTDLGRAVLRHLDQTAYTEDEIAVDVLSDDPLAYPRVIGRIARQDDAMLVDAYFGMDDLWLVLQQTRVSRLLTSRKGKGRVEGLAAALASVKTDRTFEVRTTDVIHDRFVIPAGGPVDLLGTSLSGVGKKISVMVQIDPPAAEDIRRSHEEAWDKAEILHVLTEGEVKDGDPAP